MILSLKYSIAAAFALSAIASAINSGPGPVVTKSLRSTGTGSPGATSTGGTYPYPNGTGITSFIVGTGTAVASATASLSSLDDGGLYNGTLSPAFKALIKEAQDLDEAVNKAEQEAWAAIDSLADFFGISNSTVNSTISTHLPREEGIVEKRSRFKSTPKQSKPKPAAKPKPVAKPEPSPKSSPSPKPSPTPKPSPSHQSTKKETTKPSRPPNSTHSKTSTSKHSSSTKTSTSATSKVNTKHSTLKPSSSHKSIKKETTKPSHSTPSTHSTHSTTHSTHSTTHSTHSTHSKSSTSKHSSSTKTSTSATSRVTARSLTPPCGPSKCKSVCSVPKSPKKKTSTPKRATLGSSLQAQIVKRFPSTIPLQYAESVVTGKTENNVLLLNTVERYPQLPEELGMTVSTSQVLKYTDVLDKLAKEKSTTLDKLSFNIGTGQLTGCTGVYIVSKHSVFYAHYWESLAFSDQTDPKHKVDFAGQVIKGLFSGKLDDDGGKLEKAEPVQDSLNQKKVDFTGAKVFIMTPCLSVLQPTVRRYEKQILSLRKTLRTILGEVEIKEHLYKQSDNGKYSEGEVIGVAGKELKPSTTLRTTNIYDELMFTQSGSDGYGIMQFTQDPETKKNKIRVIFEDEDMYTYEWAAGATDGPATNPTSNEE